MVKSAGGNAANVTAESVVKAAGVGDSLAKEVLTHMADHLAIWLGNIIDLFEPDAIVIGGGLAELAISMLPQVRNNLRQWACSPGHENTAIVKAFYGAESALAGAAALWVSRDEAGDGTRRQKIARSRDSRR